MGKKTIDELSQNLQTYDTRISTIEENTKKEQIEAIARDVFKQQMRDEDFRNKVKSLFSDLLKQEDFLKKVESIAWKKAREYVQSKVMWNVVIYIALGAAGVIGQRFLHIIP